MTSLIPALRSAGVECFTRSEWGSPREADGSYQRRRGTHPMPPGPAEFHFLHITVTADTDTPEEGARGARAVESFGLSTPPMVSYQDLVTNEGRYYEGQSYGVKGTHTVNDRDVPGFAHDLNLLGYATAIMQDVEHEVTDTQVRTIALVFAARELAGLVKRGAPIFPHRMFAFKSCPGDKAVARLNEIKEQRDRFVREGLPREEWFEMATKQELREVVTSVVHDQLEDLLARRLGNEETVQTSLRRAGETKAIAQQVLDRLAAG